MKTLKCACGEPATVLSPSANPKEREMCYACADAMLERSVREDERRRIVDFLKSQIPKGERDGEGRGIIIATLKQAIQRIESL